MYVLASDLNLVVCSSLLICHGAVIEGRLCQQFLGIECCLPCPMTDWAYPDKFNTFTQIANWINVAGLVSCIFLLLSWAFLPVEKTNRHYLSISLCCAVVLMNVSGIHVDICHIYMHIDFVGISILTSHSLASPSHSPQSPNSVSTRSRPMAWIQTRRVPPLERSCSLVASPASCGCS